MVFALHVDSIKKAAAAKEDNIFCLKFEILQLYITISENYTSFSEKLKSDHNSVISMCLAKYQVSSMLRSNINHNFKYAVSKWGHRID